MLGHRGFAFWRFESWVWEIKVWGVGDLRPKGTGLVCGLMPVF